MLLLPIITIVTDGPPAPLPLHRFVRTDSLDGLLIPAVHALSHRDELPVADGRFPTVGMSSTQQPASTLDGVIYLANAMDTKCEKIETSWTAARKAQPESQLAALTVAFQREYAALLSEEVPETR